MSDRPVTTYANPPSSGVRVSRSSPATETPIPATINVAGRIRRAAIGAICTPAMPATAHGIIHSPAASGSNPSTSWRYCVTSTIVAPGSIVLTSMPISEVRNARSANRPRSSSGSRIRSCRRAKTTPAAMPRRSTAAGTVRTPCRASSLSP
jgi:hypothetical protein